MEKIGFIGVGKVGTAFGTRLAEGGFPVRGAMDIVPKESRRFADSVSGCKVYATAQSLADSMDFVFITTPDDVIGQVAAQVRWHAGQTVIHCSGANSTAVLEPARKSGCHVGCMHPCNTFASIQQSLENLMGSTFTLEAEEPVLSDLKKFVAALNGRWMMLHGEDKALYHASICIACNYLYTLMGIATDLWKNFDISQSDAVAACMPILTGTLNNIEKVGFPGCLTGPIARGDVGTIRKHIAALEKAEPALVPLYKALGLATIPMGLAKGTLPTDKAAELREMLSA
ncbi:MAG: DUF2520 domain-containing protein [Dehalococcoidia bacterium]|jgi:predicted short-subunit dehydrogenase-like oxidoreductase (DUF2520 family)|nr:DUF2520 domain-containing protein [Dehalococcoidia bacterium]